MVSRQIAKEMGRSEETVRYTLRHFNRGILTWRSSRTVTAPCKPRRSGRLSSSIAAASRCRRWPSGSPVRPALPNRRRDAAARIMELPLDYIPNDQFAKLLLADVGAEGAWSDARQRGGGEEGRLPAGLPPYLAGLYEVPLLTPRPGGPPVPQDELSQVQGGQAPQQLDPSRPKSSLMDQIEKHYDEVVVTKNQIPGPTCGWWFRSPSGTSGPRRTSSSWSATATCR